MKTSKNKILIKSVLAALASISFSEVALALPPNDLISNTLVNIYINGNSNNVLNPQQQSQGVFISSSGNPRALYDTSGNYQGLTKDNNIPFAGGEFLTTAPNVYGYSATSQFSGNYAAIVDSSGNAVLFDQTTLGRDASGNVLGSGGVGENIKFTGVSGSGSGAVYDASGNLRGTQAFIGNQSNRYGSLDPVSGSISYANYDASGNVLNASNSSGATTALGNAYSIQFAGTDASGNSLGSNTSLATAGSGDVTAFSTQTAIQIDNSGNSFGLATNTSAAIAGGGVSFNSQVVGQGGAAANISGVVSLEGGSAATTIALTGPGGNALLGNLTGSLQTNTLSGTISGAGGSSLDGSGNGIFGTTVAGGVLTGSVTLGRSGVALPSASTSIYLTNIDGSASQTSLVSNISDSTAGQSMNVDASGNASVATGVQSGPFSAGSSASVDASGNFYTWNGTKNYLNKNFAGQSSYQDASGNNQTTSIGLFDGSGNGFRGLDVNGAGTYINGGTVQPTSSRIALIDNNATMASGSSVANSYINLSSSGAAVSGGSNNGGMYFDSNGVTVGKVDASGNIIGTSQIHNVAAGTAATDAVNVSQLTSGMNGMYNQINSINQQVNGLKSGIASTVAMANIPQVDQGKHYSIGMGLGHYDGASALSVGGSIRVNENAIIKGTIGHSFSNSGPADTSTAVGVGAAFSW